MEENHNEVQVPEPLRKWNLSVDGIQLAQFLQSLRDPLNPPELLFQLYQLNLICEQPFWKELSQSDVDDRQDRLLIPQREASEYILPFLNANENPGNGIPITVYDTDGYPLCFLQRNDGKYIITHREPEGKHWRDVCQAIGLNEGNSIKLWTLRHAETNQLSFVIEKVVSIV